MGNHSAFGDALPHLPPLVLASYTTLPFSCLDEPSGAFKGTALFSSAWCLGVYHSSPPPRRLEALARIGTSLSWEPQNTVGVSSAPTNPRFSASSQHPLLLVPWKQRARATPSCRSAHLIKSSGTNTVLTFKGTLGEYAASLFAMTESFFINHSSVAGWPFSCVSSLSSSPWAEVSLSSSETSSSSASHLSSPSASLPSSEAGASK